MRVSAAILAVILGSPAALAQGDPKANFGPVTQAAPAATTDAKAKANSKSKPAHKKPADLSAG
jgi:hypothetical protein